MNRIKNKLLRLIFRKLIIRPTSRPYISGDGFRSMADHLYDETKKVSPHDISEGQIVFVKTDYIDEYFKSVHPNIKSPYRLITHNSDRTVGLKEISYMDDKIIRWFAQNNICAHPKITPIPIGIENEYWFMSGHAIRIMAPELNSRKHTKKDRILFGFNINTNIKERTEAITVLRKSKISDEIKKPPEQNQYINLLNQYKFVAAPEGNGPDCHRIWEALILGVIPIIKNTSNNQIIIQNKLPALIVNRWEDILEMTEDNLSKKYNELYQFFNDNMVSIDYWSRIIKETK